jgi:hypothetical protein
MNNLKKIISNPTNYFISSKLKIDTETCYWTIIKLSDSVVDVSLFTRNEWKQLQTINDYMMQKHDTYLLKPNNTQNIIYVDKILWFDTELKKSFGVKFNDIEYDCSDKEEISLEIKKLSKENCVETNKLREWFINNYQKLEQYYKELLEGYI